MCVSVAFFIRRGQRERLVRKLSIWHISCIIIFFFVSNGLEEWKGGMSSLVPSPLFLFKGRKYLIGSLLFFLIPLVMDQGRNGKD